ncbi:hypothetical protein ACN38_g2108 [Penicillium nordicum]|uniref:Uncharacterized protein n=1 Tax=Penicillium nordicum TaxID=229535 RepID=A0A0M9WJ87_9EURO|nr:hypothetical protein ACN38_g2108 [Penicillium nordicum]
MHGKTMAGVQIIGAAIVSRAGGGLYSSPGRGLVVGLRRGLAMILNSSFFNYPLQYKSIEIQFRFSSDSIQIQFRFNSD